MLFFGHGLNGVEGMASGLPVVSNLEDLEFRDLLNNYTFFAKCPIVSASPSTLTNVLRNLILNPSLRKELGVRGRKYVERWHSADAAKDMFSAVLDFLDGNEFSLKNFYHPLKKIKKD